MLVGSDGTACGTLCIGGAGVTRVIHDRTALSRAQAFGAGDFSRNCREKIARRSRIRSISMSSGLVAPKLRGFPYV